MRPTGCTMANVVGVSAGVAGTAVAVVVGGVITIGVAVDSASAVTVGNAIEVDGLSVSSSRAAGVTSAGARVGPGAQATKKTPDPTIKKTLNSRLILVFITALSFIMPADA